MILAYGCALKRRTIGEEEIDPHKRRNRKHRELRRTPDYVLGRTIESAVGYGRFWLGFRIYGRALAGLGLSGLCASITYKRLSLNHVCGYTCFDVFEGLFGAERKYDDGRMIIFMFVIVSLLFLFHVFRV